MLLIFLISLALEIPTGYGQFSFNPIYFLKTQSVYGDYVNPILPSNILIADFYVPYNDDISLYFSKSFDMKTSIFSFDFIPKVYNVKKALTILNSCRGSNDFSYAGLFFREGYKNLTFSFSGDFSSLPAYRTSALNPRIDYIHGRGKSSVFFYRFKRDSIRYVKILLIENKFDGGKKNIDLIYGESLKDRVYYFSGIKTEFQIRNITFDGLGEKTSDGSFTWKVTLRKSSFKVGLTSPFGKRDNILPIIFVRKKFGKIFVNLSGNSVQPDSPDSNYRYYSIAGIGVDFSRLLKLYLGTGNLGEGDMYAGGYKFITGNVFFSTIVKSIKFKFAGNFFKPLDDVNMDRDFNSRFTVSYRRKFGSDSSLRIGIFLDYFGDHTVHLSVFSDFVLFGSVKLRVEEYNLNRSSYPFNYPGNSDNFYRISVVTYLWD